jgi:ABC-2 type transport system permease protein
MQALFLKELRQFFSSLTGYLSIGLFLLLMGLFLFVFPDTSIFDFGYMGAFAAGTSRYHAQSER